MSLPHSRQSPKPDPPNDFWVNVGFVAIIGAFFVAIAVVIAPVVLAAFIIFFLVRVTRIQWWWMALGGLATFVVLQVLGLPPIEIIEHSFHKANHLADREGFEVAVARIWRYKGRWLLRALPGLPVGVIVGSFAGTLFDAHFPVFDPRAEVQKQKKIVVSRQRAAKKVPTAPDQVKDLAVLGPFAHGDFGRPWVASARGRRYLCMHPSVLGRHVVVVGKPGSGKTVTLLRLSYLAAKLYGWRVYFLDGKGDSQTMREFTSLMLSAGLPPKEIGAFPNQAFDGWRASGDQQQQYSQLLNRLMGALTFSEPYYRDLTRRYLSKAIRARESLPQSSSELLERLGQLADSAPNELRQEARSTHARYEALFDSFPGQLDGGWSFSDCRSGYVLLKGLSNRDEAQNIAGYLFECFKQFATDMKHESDRVLLVVDEFPALTGESDTAGMIERLRSFGCGVALSGQNYEGLGPDRARIVEAAGTLILHRLSDSDDLAKLAGTVQEFALTTQVDFSEGSTGRGTVTPEHRFKAEPNVIGRQVDGEVTLIADRCVGHGFVTKAPTEPHMAAATDLLMRSQALRNTPAAPLPEPEPSHVFELR